MWRLLVGPGALVLGVAVAAGAALGLAAEPADGSLVDASVEGTLDRVVTEEEGIILKTKDGRLLGWELPAPVIEEAAKYEKGTPMWVIYRKLDPETEAVTALGFPGVATVPVYVNATGYSVVLRTGPAVDGRCQADGAPAGTDQKLGPGIATEVLSACWCCAPEGDTCAPSNHSGKGRIVLAQCFKSGPDWRDGQN